MNCTTSRNYQFYALLSCTLIVFLAWFSSASLMVMLPIVAVLATVLMHSFSYRPMLAVDMTEQLSNGNCPQNCHSVRVANGFIVFVLKSQPWRRIQFVFSDSLPPKHFRRLCAGTYLMQSKTLSD
ncbi:hypothetical protein DBZ36_09335 [Alginatibacterium sediminis]|uniref:Uncharacterized protein n=1 Tax=Alginatibacterium sediminis TaxID=2164068 RepID=A0A420ED48_9ALTE|nr:hypothetical protein DBZ36_09335 [Alginatibacterium sediminis]